MTPLHDQGFARYWLVVRGDREFRPGELPPSFAEARRMLAWLADDDFARRRIRSVLADDFHCHDLFRYNDDQVLDLLAQQVAAGRAQIYREEPERPALTPAFEPKPPHKPRAAARIREETTWIEIELVDEQGKPVPGVRYEIGRPNGTPLSTGRLDDLGLARVDGIPAGEYQVGFPDLDGKAWSGSGAADKARG
jgi:hypothetical protein